MTAARLRLLSVTIGVALVALPASGQQAAKLLKTKVWMDVASHSMADMGFQQGGTNIHYLEKRLTERRNKLIGLG